MHRLTVATVAILVMLSPQAMAAQPTAPEWFPTKLAHVENSNQVIVVTAARWTSTSGTLRAFERSTTGNWVQVVEATPARLGYGGLVPAADRRQGTGKTPLAPSQLSQPLADSQIQVPICPTPNSTGVMRGPTIQNTQLPTIFSRMPICPGLDTENTLSDFGSTGCNTTTWPS